MQIADAPEDQEREIEGLFLRIPERPKTVERPEWTFKIMADIYTKLGIYAGADGAMPDFGPLDTFDWRFGIGMSRNIYLQNNAYTSFYIDEDGSAKRHWNSGVFFGTRIPVRYESDVDAKIDLGKASWDISLLLLSDPRFRADFGNRDEGIDWGFILNQSEEEEVAGTTVSSLRWQTQLRWRPDVSIVSPWISSLNVSSLRAELRWKTRLDEDAPAPALLPASDNSPERSFFYPESAVFPEATLQLQGELFRLPSRRTRERTEPEEDERDGRKNEEESEDATDPPRALRPPWEADAEARDEKDAGYRLPERAPNLTGIGEIDRGQLRLTYSLRPTLRIDRVTDNGGWNSADDVGLDWRYSTFQSRKSWMRPS